MESATLTGNRTINQFTTIQQKRINKRRPKIPKVDLQALPEKIKAAENIQQKHC